MTMRDFFIYKPKITLRSTKEEAKRVWEEHRQAGQKRKAHNRALHVAALERKSRQIARKELEKARWIAEEPIRKANAKKQAEYLAKQQAQKQAKEAEYRLAKEKAKQEQERYANLLTHLKLKKTRTAVPGSRRHKAGWTRLGPQGKWDQTVHMRYLTPRLK